MNKQELVQRVSEKTGRSKKECAAVLDGVLSEITESLQRDEKVKLVNFGSFEVAHRAARQGRNPRNNQTVAIPARDIPVFKAGRTLRERVDPSQGG